MLSNIGTNEDASVFKITDDIALVQTLDFITPVADDPFIFGQIAAANSLSDVFAMGSKILNALNIVGFDSCNLSGEILGEILRGGQDKVAECGGVIVGGHTIETQQMYYGLSVTGIVSPSSFWSNNTAREGDALILTKPLGTGILSTAIKADLLNLTQIEQAVDVTGFGFFGHLSEMLNDKISFEIYASNVPVIAAAREFADMGIIPEGSYKNREFASKFVSGEADILLYDAQTSGGLLLAVPQSEANLALSRLKEVGYESSEIVGIAKKRGEYGINLR